MKGKLSDAYPHLAAEWNDPEDIDDFSHGSNYEAHWKCQRGHEYTASVGYRVKGYGDCIACVSIGYMHPHLVPEWDTEKNTASPFEVRAGSGKKVWWTGVQCQHSWEMEARARVRFNYGCPYCSGQRVLEGFNDLATTHPELADQWDYQKNKKRPTEITHGVKTKVWWTDARCGHSWEMSPLHRTKLKDPSCIVCRSVAVKHPELVKEWADKNDPFTIAAGSHTRIKWKCLLNPKHVWDAATYNRSTMNQGCPYCAGRKVISGESDVMTTHPHLVQEWDESKDLGTFSFGSNYKAQWKCTKDKNHTWKATISDRAAGRSHCPHCSNHVSKKEQEVIDYVKSLGVQVERDRKILGRRELDIYVPEKNIAIEFNGVYWHSEAMGKDKWYHYNKWKDCHERGIQLLTIWEDDWNRNEELVKRLIAYKIGVSAQRKIPARNTHCLIADKKEAQEFYESNHIQGHKDGEHFALRDKHTKEIIAMSTLSYLGHEKEVRLERFATSQVVQGGFSKLLSYMRKTIADHEQEYERIVTFADHTVSNGDLYANNGFIADKELPPDYMYVYKGERSHKFGFRIKRFRNDPNLRYVENHTEKELAQLNRVYRIWDCGKTRYTMAI